MTNVILFHHAQGLTEGVRKFADELRAAGHQVTVPDLYEGRTFATVEEGVAHAQEIGFDKVLERGRRAVEGLPDDVVYAGFSLGVMSAQALAQTKPGARGALFFHGCLPLSEFGDGSWPGIPVQIHAMDHDPFFVDEGDIEAARALVQKVHRAQLFLYPGDGHLFADNSLASYDEPAARLMMQRVLAALALWGRGEPALAVGELESLKQFLDRQRETVLVKTAGLSREEMGLRLPSSNLSLGGIVYHLAVVEEGWLEQEFLDQKPREPWASVDFQSDPDWEFRNGAELEPEAVRQRYLEACERSRQVVAGASGLDQVSRRHPEEQFSLRWILLHLIEETARHIGHCDLLREAIDGSVGE